MIFLDTSGVIALADQDDEFHQAAVRMFDAVRDSGEDILIHNYVIVESGAVLQRKLGMTSSLKFVNEASYFNVCWVDPVIHTMACGYLAQNGGSKLSLVDAVSFLVMRSNGVTEFIGFDKHFTDAGFIQYGSNNP